MTRAERARARRLLNQAVADGILKRPDTCEDCGQKPQGFETWGTGGRIKVSGIVAHHHRGYDEQHALDVQWLCIECHSRVHCMPARAASTTRGGK